MEFRIIELFGGIGAFTKALRELKIPHKIVDYVEIDKYAVASFNAINETNFEPQDIREYDKTFLNVDLIVHGSPCQDFSIAGAQKSGERGSGTRSSLLYESLRVIENIKPKYVVWENVKNLLSGKHRHIFDDYYSIMFKMGYHNDYFVLNAKDYGIPQNRERVFTISIRNDVYSGTPTTVPEPQELTKVMADYLESNVDPKYIIGKDMDWVKYKDISNTIRVGGRGSCDRHTWDAIRVIGELQIKGNDQIKRVYDQNALSPTLSTMGGGNRQPKIVENSHVRRLTARECWRLMGFEDCDFDKCAKINSETQLYKQAGNSIVVNVAKAVLERIFENGD